MNEKVWEKFKPIGRPSYGSIAHLPNSAMGVGDKRIEAGQARICWEKPRDKHDLIVVQEKLDGSCVSVAKHENKIIALGRAGYAAESSKYEMHRLFAEWVKDKEDFFSTFLKEGERAVGEWLAQAHGTKYKLFHEPFVCFDIMTGPFRIPWTEFVERTRDNCITPAVLHTGGALPENDMLSLMTCSRHGGEWMEGVIYRVYRKGVFDFAAKYVKPNFENGKYLNDISGHPDVWNWRPEQ